MDWLQRHLDYTFRPLLGESWILDVDTTVKPLYGRQEGAAAGAFPTPAAPSAAPGADEAAYAVVTPATSGRSASATPAACRGRLRRR